MLCAISGEAPQEPVASRKSGHIFERRLIEAHIQDNGTDPITNEPLSLDDLLPLQSARVVKPRPPTLTSIPALLSTFQNEWDALALETFQLKQQLAQTRQELSTALYQHDAAVRVIARLTRERDEAREALSRIQVAGGTAQNGRQGDDMEVDGQGLPAEVLARVEETQQKLQSTRRKRQVPEEWATAEVIQSFDVSSTSDVLYPGAKALAVHKEGDSVLLGGKEGVLGIYSIQQKEVLAGLKCGAEVEDALWWDDKPVAATSNGVIRVFDGKQEMAAFDTHAGAAKALSLHPSGNLLASVGVDKSWALYDLEAMKVIAQTYSDSELTTGAFHPDGHLFAAGTSSGDIVLYDVKTTQVAATFPATTSAAISALSFSENGTWLASSSDGSSTVTIWNLRKMDAMKTLDIGSAVRSITWDYTGQFLAVAGPGCLAVQAYSKAEKAWSEPFRKAMKLTNVAWGSNARSLIAATEAGEVAILGAS